MKSASAPRTCIPRMEGHMGNRSYRSSLSHCRCAFRGVLQILQCLPPPPCLHSPLPSPPKWVAASPSRHSFERASKMTTRLSQLPRGGSRPAGLALWLRDPSQPTVSEQNKWPRARPGRGLAPPPLLPFLLLTHNSGAEFLTISFSP